MSQHRAQKANSNGTMYVTLYYMEQTIWFQNLEWGSIMDYLFTFQMQKTCILNLKHSFLRKFLHPNRTNALLLTIFHWPSLILIGWMKNSSVRPQLSNTLVIGYVKISDTNHVSAWFYYVRYDKTCIMVWTTSKWVDHLFNPFTAIADYSRHVFMYASAP